MKIKNIIMFTVLSLFGLPSKAQIFIDNGTDGILSISSASSGTLGAAESEGSDVGLFVDGDLVIEGEYNNQATETQIGGGINNTGTFNTTGDEVFINSISKNISGTYTGTNDFYNLILKSPSSPVAKIVCSSDLEINTAGILKLDGGILDASTNYILLKNTSATAIQGVGTNGDLDNFILGKIRRNIIAGTTYDFPTGGTAANSGGGDGQQKISFKSNTGDGIVAVDFTAGDGIGVGNTTTICSGANGSIDYLINNGNWTVTNPGGGISDYDITLHPTDFTDNSYVDFTIIKDGAATGLDACDGVATTLPITHSGLTSFSLFQVGAKVSSSLLPIELLGFDAVPVANQKVKISWSTLSESNNDYFTVQRSMTGSNWEDLGKINGAGNSNQRLDYQFMDNHPILDGAYYRLMQTDLDGKYAYSDIKFVTFEDNDHPLIISPNPAHHQITIEGHQEDLNDIQLYNFLGTKININMILLSKNEERIVLDISNLPLGVYLISSKSKAFKFQKI